MTAEGESVLKGARYVRGIDFLLPSSMWGSAVYAWQQSAWPIVALLGLVALICSVPHVMSHILWAKALGREFTSPATEDDGKEV